MSKSQTPRTDAERRVRIFDHEVEDIVPTRLAMELETELAATRARLAELEAAVKKNREREDAAERELCRVSDVACYRAVKLAKLEKIAEKLYEAIETSKAHGIFLLPSAIKAYEAYKEGKK